MTMTCERFRNLFLTISFTAWEPPERFEWHIHAGQCPRCDEWVSAFPRSPTTPEQHAEATALAASDQLAWEAARNGQADQSR